MHDEVKCFFQQHVAEPFNEDSIKSPLSNLLLGRGVFCHVPDRQSQTCLGIAFSKKLVACRVIPESSLMWYATLFIVGLAHEQRNCSHIPYKKTRSLTQ